MMTIWTTRITGAGKKLEEKLSDLVVPGFDAMRGAGRLHISHGKSG